MTALPPESRGLVALTSFFQTWARQGLSTADIWASLRYLEDQGQVTLEGVSASSVSTMRGIAASLNRNEDQVASLPPEASIENLNIPTAPWARSPVEQSLAPQWQIRILQTYLDAQGNEQQAIRTIIARGDLPATMAGLADFADTEGQALIDTGAQDTASAQVSAQVLGVFQV